MPDNKTYFYIKKWIDKNWQLTLMVILPLSFIILFHYVPMYGIQIAFKNYRAVDGIWGSKWVGFDHFIKFFKSYQFIRVTRNTIMLSLYSLIR
jgi:putative aldouronate transport system permease protein